MTEPPAQRPSATPRLRPRVAGVVATTVAWGLLLAVVGFQQRGLGADDMYITYRYAHNLAQGSGLTFNPGERVFGVSDPGVALLLAAGSAATGAAIPLLGTMLMAAALGASAGALLLEAKAPAGFAAAATAGALAVSSPLLWLGQGSGPLVALAFLLVAALLAQRHPVAAGALAGVAAWCRPDALGGCVALVVLAWRRGRRPPLALMTAAGLVCAAGLACARIYYGRFFPGTLAVKQQFAARIPGEPTGLAGFWGRALEVLGTTEGRWAWLVLPLALIGAPVLFRRGGPAARLLLVYAAALACGYTVLRVPFSFWYVGPVAFALLASGCMALAWAAGWLARRVSVTAAALLVVASLVAAVWPLALWRLAWLGQARAGDWRRAGYEAAGRWLAEHTELSADVAFDEIGIVGFYSERPMLDLVGLVSPSSVPFTAAGDQVGAFLARPTRYVLFHTASRRGGTRPIVATSWFRRGYRRAATLELPRFGVSMVVFERRRGARLPPPRPPLDRRLRRQAANPPDAASRILGE